MAPDPSRSTAPMARVTPWSTLGTGLYTCISVGGQKAPALRKVWVLKQSIFKTVLCARSTNYVHFIIISSISIKGGALGI